MIHRQLTLLYYFYYYVLGRVPMFYVSLSRGTNLTTDVRLILYKWGKCRENVCGALDINAV